MLFPKIHYVLAGLQLPALAAATTPSCNADNVLRALQSHTPAAASFCSQFLATASNHATITLPTYVSNYPSSRVSSGCSCLSSTSSPTPTHSTTASTPKKTTSTYSVISTLSSKASSVLSSTVKSSTTGISSTKTSSLPSSSIKSSTAGTSSTKTGPVSSSKTSIPSSSRVLSFSSAKSLSSTKTSSSSTQISSSSSKQPTHSSTSSTHTISSSSLATFTGTTVKAFSSPASCYSLPTPISSLVIASNNLTTNTSLNSPISIYVGQNGTTAYYYSLIVNGTTYLYDITNPNQIAITSSNGQSLLVNTTGFYIFGANCNGALAVNIANFAQQINTLSNTTSLTRRSRGLSKRRETSFVVDAFIEDQCGNPVTDMNPSVDVGTSPCQFEQAISGNMAWLCQFPGANSPEQQCESSVNNALHYVTQGFGGQLTNIGGAAAIIAKYFPASTIGQLIAGAAKGIAGVAFGELLIDALGALALAEIAIALVGQDNIAYGLCSLIHINDGPLVLHLITAEQDLGLGILSFAPTPTYDAGTVTVSDPATTDCPCVAGVCGSFNVIYSPLCGVVGDCVCVTDVDGQGVCVEDVYCADAVACGSDADCPGGACWANSCCGGNICAPLSTVCTPLTKRSPRKDLTLSSGLEKMDRVCNSGALC